MPGLALMLPLLAIAASGIAWGLLSPLETYADGRDMLVGVPRVESPEQRRLARAAARWAAAEEREAWESEFGAEAAADHLELGAGVTAIPACPWEPGDGVDDVGLEGPEAPPKFLLPISFAPVASGSSLVDKKWHGVQPTLVRSSKPVATRFEDKVSPEPMSGCWLWLGYATKKGYPRLALKKRWISEDGRPMVRKDAEPAYRVGYQIFRGKIPDGLELDHLCRNPACVNPWHLEAVTHAENIRRGVAAKRAMEMN